MHFQSPYISDDLFHFSNICHYRPASQLLCCDDILNGSVDLFIHLKFNACLLLGIHVTQFEKFSLVCRKMDRHALLYKSNGCQTRGVIVSFFSFIFLSCIDVVLSELVKPCKKSSSTKLSCFFFCIVPNLKDEWNKAWNHCMGSSTVSPRE